MLACLVTSEQLALYLQPPSHILRPSLSLEFSTNIFPKISFFQVIQYKYLVQSFLYEDLEASQEISRLPFTNISSRMLLENILVMKNARQVFVHMPSMVGHDTKFSSLSFKALFVSEAKLSLYNLVLVRSLLRCAFAIEDGLSCMESRKLGPLAGEARVTNQRATKLSICYNYTTTLSIIHRI